MLEHGAYGTLQELLNRLLQHFLYRFEGALLHQMLHRSRRPVSQRCKTGVTLHEAW
ncbi:MAG: hypothetical protein ACXVP5_12800 [Tumebacillaceae bacterium]